jgi:hypothetical protein
VTVDAFIFKNNLDKLDIFASYIGMIQSFLLIIKKAGGEEESKSYVQLKYSCDSNPILLNAIREGNENIGNHFVFLYDCLHP